MSALVSASAAILTASSHAVFQSSVHVQNHLNKSQKYDIKYLAFPTASCSVWIMVDLWYFFLLLKFVQENVKTQHF